MDSKFTEIFIENHKKFRDFLAARVGSRQIAEDLLQNSVRKAIEHPAGATDEKSILAWFYTILKNTLTDHYRAKASEEKKNDEFLKELAAQDGTHAKAADELEAIVCECLNGLLPTLRENYAELIRKIDLEQKPVDEVAAQLGITANNLMVRLHRARQALKLSLERTCGTCTEHGCLDCRCG